MQEPQIIFEDDCLLAINKPAGVVVNRAISVKGQTIQDWMEKKLKIQNPSTNNESETRNLKLETNSDWDSVNRQAFYDRAGIVHRLDKETSGVLVIAKTPYIFIELLRQFREREVKKTYLSLVHGNLANRFKLTQGFDGIVNEPVGRLPWNRTRFGVLPKGREAITKFRILKTYFLPEQSRKREKIKASPARTNLEAPTSSTPLRSDQGEKVYSLLELQPETGRTHQIRVHMKHIGHPVVSDTLYAGRKTARADRRWCPRLFLHAHTLELTHPNTKKKIKIIAQPSEDLQRVLDRLNAPNIPIADHLQYATFI